MLAPRVGIYASKGKHPATLVLLAPARRKPVADGAQSLLDFRRAAHVYDATHISLFFGAQPPADVVCLPSPFLPLASLGVPDAIEDAKCERA